MVVPTNANVDKEWATTLVGLRMKVPGSWWDNTDSSGNHLHPGKIHSINFAQIENQNYWQLQLDDVDEPELYPMRYDAVVAYADESCPSYSSFRLPVELVPNPVNERASQNCKEYIWTDPTYWTVLKDGEDVRIIEPIPYTGESEEFLISCEQLSLDRGCTIKASKYYGR